MIKHRYFLPALMGLSSLFGLIPTSVSIVEYGAARPFIPAVGLGVLLGLAVFILCARWIKNSQAEGVVYLGWWTEIVIAGYYGCIIAVGWLTYTSMSWMHWSCVLLSASESSQCAIAFSVFRSTLELGLLGGLYVWGLVYEKQIGRPLMYRMAFIEKHPEVRRRD